MALKRMHCYAALAKTEGVNALSVSQFEILMLESTK